VIFLVDVRTNKLETVIQRGIDKNVVELLSQSQETEYFRSLQGVGRGNVLPQREEREKRADGEAKILAVLSACQVHIWVPFAVNEHFKGGIGLGEKLSGDP
jgi:hypothetical protein